VVEPFEYLNRLFPPDFIASLTEENYLYRLLTDDDLEINDLRSNVNESLELAYRYNLVDADLEARLKKGDRESWQANINELSVPLAVTLLVVVVGCAPSYFRRGKASSRPSQATMLFKLNNYDNRWVTFAYFV